MYPLLYVKRYESVSMGGCSTLSPVKDMSFSPLENAVHVDEDIMYTRVLISEHSKDKDMASKGQGDNAIAEETGGEKGSNNIGKCMYLQIILECVAEPSHIFDISKKELIYKCIAKLKLNSHSVTNCTSFSSFKVLEAGFFYDNFTPQPEIKIWSQSKILKLCEWQHSQEVNYSTLLLR